MNKTLLGTVGGILIGSCGLMFPSHVDLGSVERNLSSAFQNLLPLLGAGGGIPPAPCSGAVFTLVQQNDALTGSCTSCSATVTAAPTNGNMLALVVSSLHAATISTVSSVTSTNTIWTKDGAGGTSINCIGGSNHCDLEVWHGLVSGGAGGTTITVVWSAALLANTMTYNLSEWSGENTSTTVDGTPVSHTGGVSPVVTGAYSTTATCDLVIVAGGIGFNGFTTFPAAPYTTLSHPTGTSAGSYNILSPMGSQTQASWTFTGSTTWVSLIVGYLHA